MSDKSWIKIEYKKRGEDFKLVYKTNETTIRKMTNYDIEDFLKNWIKTSFNQYYYLDIIDILNDVKTNRRRKKLLKLKERICQKMKK
jgi:hypothetical protein